jgi:DNA-binding NarL/FixJ family response regulator
MGVRTLNAGRALPEELAKQVCEALGGGACCLWVPSRKNLKRYGRDRLIVRLHEDGHSARDIAGRVFISQRTVWRVLAKARDAGRLPSDPTAGQPQRDKIDGASHG